MTIRSLRRKLMLSATVIIFTLLCASRSFALQASSPAPMPQQAPAAKPDTSATPATAPAAAKVDPAEEADYKAFYDLKPGDNDKHIELGEAFVQKYPNSKYLGGVYSQLVTSEYNKQDFNKMYADADKALAANPDEVTVLVLVGWVIPHSSNANDVNYDAQLDKAEKEEKHALELLPTLASPPNMTPEQFEKAKAESTSQAHSGLGLVYFRKGNYDGAVSELNRATASSANPDATDYYVTGVSLGHLNRYSEASDAFTKCAAIPGGLQARCKQQADDAKKQAAAKPATKP